MSALGRLPWIALVMGLLAFPVRADEFEIRRIKSVLDRNAQEQQFVRQQIQLTQGLLRGEESRTLVGHSYVVLLPASRMDLLGRQEGARDAEAQRHQDELDRLASRYRELEERRRRLAQTPSLRAHQRNQD